MEQVCVKCGELKDIGLFPKEKRPDGAHCYRKTCKKCRNVEKILLICTNTPETKKCSKCGEEKLITDFNKSYSGKYGYDNRCKSCKNEGSIERGKKPNTLKLKNINGVYFKKCSKCEIEKDIKYFNNNPRTSDNLSTICKACFKTYRDTETFKHRRNLLKLTRIKNDPGFRLRCNVSASIIHYLKGEGKSKKSLDLLGVSRIEEYREYIENQLIDTDFSWSNYGKEWQIDHIIPVNVFDLSNVEHQHVAFNHKNTRPLSKFENLSRSKNVKTSDIELVKSLGLVVSEEVEQYLKNKEEKE